MASEQIASLESSLTRLAGLLPDLPQSELLLVRLVRNLAQDLGTMLEHTVRPHGLGEGEFRVLSGLYSQPQGSAHPGDLCSRTAQSPANMSRITDALVEQGLITRLPSAEDRRKLVLSITDKGIALVRRVMPELFQPLRHVCAHLSAKEQQVMIHQLRECLMRIESACRKDETEGGT